MEIYKGDPRPNILPRVIALSAMGLKLWIFGFMLAKHTKANSKQVQLFIYLFHLFIFKEGSLISDPALLSMRALYYLFVIFAYRATFYACSSLHSGHTGDMHMMNPDYFDYRNTKTQNFSFMFGKKLCRFWDLESSLHICDKLSSN